MSVRLWLCLLGFHRWRRVKGEPGHSFTYWTERCTKCTVERTVLERIKDRSGPEAY